MTITVEKFVGKFYIAKLDGRTIAVDVNKANVKKTAHLIAETLTPGALDAFVIAATQRARMPAREGIINGSRKLTWKRVGSADAGTLEYQLLANDKHVATVTNEGDIGEPNWTISTVATGATLGRL